ncbi:DNA -binding domain-containing protein [Bradyrhizobium sp. USDA 4515]
MRHRLWLRKFLPGGSLVAVDLPLDRNFDIRLQAAHQFWLALEQRPVGRPPLTQSVTSRHRHVLALRGVDGWLEGNSYRKIAQGLFGVHRIPDRGWKTHDLRSRTIRLVQMGLRLMRGGYRDLLRRKVKD